MLVYGADLTQKMGLPRALVLNFDQLWRNSYSTFRFFQLLSKPHVSRGGPVSQKMEHPTARAVRYDIDRCTTSELDEECIPSFQVSIGHETTLWLCQNSYWTWPFIVDLPIKNGGSFHSYISLPEGTNLVTLRQGSDGVSVQSLGKWFMFLFGVCSVSDSLSAYVGEEYIPRAVCHAEWICLIDITQKDVMIIPDPIFLISCGEACVIAWLLNIRVCFKCSPTHFWWNPSQGNFHR